VIVTERRPVAQALEHLLREASSRVPAGEAVQVVGRRRAGRQTLEILPTNEPQAAPRALRAPRASPEHGADVAGRSLSVILAKLLLETQGATLTCTLSEDGTWAAAIEFPAKE
jgi:hypothetical protein